MNPLNPLTLSERQLLFFHWVNRKADILSEDGVIWRGNKHARPLALHKAIDDVLDNLRPPRISITAPLPKRGECFPELKACPLNEKMFISE